MHAVALANRFNAVRGAHERAQRCCYRRRTGEPTLLNQCCRGERIRNVVRQRPAHLVDRTQRAPGTNKCPADNTTPGKLRLREALLGALNATKEYTRKPGLEPRADR